MKREKTGIEAAIMPSLWHKHVAMFICEKLLKTLDEDKGGRLDAKEN